MESDQYMPEYWPANRIIGKLEKALVKAENILGLIQSEQIANLAAGKVTGLLTSAQIEAIEAAKIAGQLTNEQIKEIEAAKITGQLLNSQLKEIAAEKITGTISETQIGPESVTTPKIKANAVTAVKIAAEAITAEKIAALTITAGKLATNSVTSEKINALAVTSAKIAAEAITTEKLAANSVTAAKIVAGTITAEKLNVAELSAISANLGTITAGTLKAVKIEGGTGSFEGELTALKLQLGVVNEKLENKSMIKWVGKEVEGRVGVEENFLGLAYTYIAEVIPTSVNFHGPMQLKMKYRTGTAGEAERNGLTFKFREFPEKLIFGEWHAKGKANISEASDFVQLPSTAKQLLARGIAEVVWPGGTNTHDIVITHGLGSIPLMVVATNTSPTLGLWQITVDTGSFNSTQFTARSTFNTGFAPGAGSVTFVSWIAMT